MKFIKSKSSKQPIFCGYQMKLMLLPFLILFAVFTVLPVLASMVLSFFEYDVMIGAKWAGIDNYIYMFFEDDVFKTALKKKILAHLIQYFLIPSCKLDNFLI